MYNYFEEAELAAFDARVSINALKHARSQQEAEYNAWRAKAAIEDIKGLIELRPPLVEVIIKAAQDVLEAAKELEELCQSMTSSAMPAMQPSPVQVESHPSAPNVDRR